jgi:ubiquitin-protein ligase
VAEPFPTPATGAAARERMVGKACSSRLQKEYRALLTEPRPNIEAHPRADNILEW